MHKTLIPQKIEIENLQASLFPSQIMQKKKSIIIKEK